MTTLLRVRHNIEVAHRLSLLPGKCEAIHGHSMWVTLDLSAPIDAHGLAGGLDFGTVKKAFRGHLDAQYDHHLILNEEDPIAACRVDSYGVETPLPGLRLVPGDPTTENIAAWVGYWAIDAFPMADGLRVTVNETHVNAAVWAGGMPL